MNSLLNMIQISNKDLIKYIESYIAISKEFINRQHARGIEIDEFSDEAKHLAKAQHYLYLVMEEEKAQLELIQCMEEGKRKEKLLLKHANPNDTFFQ